MKDAEPPRLICTHCGTVFAVERLGTHTPKRGVMFCPYCGSAKLETVKPDEEEQQRWT